mmetsp:Transcript_82845/g.256057  ORF Transcript_82845/g.256057 Transcript_82845/m.256057 type:complete len:264 (+) Transcript_82845:404-1195(+)
MNALHDQHEADGCLHEDRDRGEEVVGKHSADGVGDAELVVAGPRGEVQEHQADAAEEEPEEVPTGEMDLHGCEAPLRDVVADVLAVAEEEVVASGVLHDVLRILDDPLALLRRQLLHHLVDVGGVAVVRQRHPVALGLVVEQKARDHAGQTTKASGGRVLHLQKSLGDGVPVLHDLGQGAVAGPRDALLVHVGHVIHDYKVVVEVAQLDATQAADEVVYGGADAAHEVDGDEAVVTAAQGSNVRHLLDDRPVVDVQARGHRRL